MLVSNDQSIRLVIEKNTELIDHHLDRFLQMRSHPLEHHHVAELERQQGRPPADGQVLAVHAVQLTVLTHSVVGAEEGKGFSINDSVKT